MLSPRRIQKHHHAHILSSLTTVSGGQLVASIESIILSYPLYFILHMQNPDANWGRISGEKYNDFNNTITLVGLIKKDKFRLSHNFIEKKIKSDQVLGYPVFTCILLLQIPAVLFGICKIHRIIGTE